MNKASINNTKCVKEFIKNLELIQNKLIGFRLDLSKDDSISDIHTGSCFDLEVLYKIYKYFKLLEINEYFASDNWHDEIDCIDEYLIGLMNKILQNINIEGLYIYGVLFVLTRIIIDIDDCGLNDKKIKKLFQDTLNRIESNIKAIEDENDFEYYE